MNAVKSIFLLSVVCLIAVSSGCRGMNFQSRPVLPEDEVIELNKQEPSPAAKDGYYQRGDIVDIIDNDGTLIFGEKVDATCTNLALVRHFSGIEEWVAVDENGRYAGSEHSSDVIEKTASKGYRFKHGGRSKFYIYYPAEQVFHPPHSNHNNLKIGDTVYKNIFSFDGKEKGVVTDLPNEQSGNFRVLFENQKNSTEVARSEIYSPEPAKQEGLPPGTFVFYDGIYHGRDWVMIVGKRGDKIIIREEMGRTDLIVDTSKLRIFK